MCSVGVLRLDGRTLEELTPWLKRISSCSTGGAGNGTLREVAIKLGQRDTYCPPWLVITAKRKLTLHQQRLQQRAAASSNNNNDTANYYNNKSSSNPQQQHYTNNNNFQLLPKPMLQATGVFPYHCFS